MLSVKTRKLSAISFQLSAKEGLQTTDYRTTKPGSRRQRAERMAQGGAGGSKTVGTRQRAVKDRIED